MPSAPSRSVSTLGALGALLAIRPTGDGAAARVQWAPARDHRRCPAPRGRQRGDRRRAARGRMEEGGAAHRLLQLPPDRRPPRRRFDRDLRLVHEQRRVLRGARLRATRERARHPRRPRQDRQRRLHPVRPRPVQRPAARLHLRGQPVRRAGRRRAHRGLQSARSRAGQTFGAQSGGQHRSLPRLRLRVPGARGRGWVRDRGAHPAQEHPLPGDRCRRAGR